MPVPMSIFRVLMFMCACGHAYFNGKLSVHGHGYGYGHGHRHRRGHRTRMTDTDTDFLKWKICVGPLINILGTYYMSLRFTLMSTVCPLGSGLCPPSDLIPCRPVSTVCLTLHWPSFVYTVCLLAQMSLYKYVQYIWNQPSYGIQRFDSEL